MPENKPEDLRCPACGFRLCEKCGGHIVSLIDVFKSYQSLLDVMAVIGGQHQSGCITIHANCHY